jgi:hypothetical protein
MLTAISSQSLAGSYKDSSFRKNDITTNWIEETKPSTTWQTDLTNPTTTWTDDLTKPSTNWQNA